MESVLKTKIASRGWHFYGKTSWKSPKKDNVCRKKRKTTRSHCYTGFSIWGIIAFAHLCACLKHRDVQKKARLVWLEKLQGVRQIAHLKEQCFSSPTFFKIQRSYIKNHVYLLFHWSSGENCIIFTFSVHKGGQTSTN